MGVRSFLAVVAVATFGIGGAAIAYAATSDSSGIVNTQTLRLVQSADNNTYLDAGVRGYSRGDRNVFWGPLVWASDRSAAGELDGSCTVIRPTVPREECDVELLLPRGVITLSGPFRAPGIAELAVIGGTRGYANVRGDAVIDVTMPPDVEVTVHLQP